MESVVYRSRTGNGGSVRAVTDKTFKVLPAPAALSSLPFILLKIIIITKTEGISSVMMLAPQARLFPVNKLHSGNS